MKGMVIDEEREWDLSDHNKITVQIEKNRTSNIRSRKTMKFEFWDIRNREKMENFAEFCAKQMEEEEGTVDVGRTEEIMRVAADKFLSLIHI